MPAMPGPRNQVARVLHWLHSVLTFEAGSAALEAGPFSAPRAFSPFGLLRKRWLGMTSLRLVDGNRRIGCREWPRCQVLAPLLIAGRYNGDRIILGGWLTHYGPPPAICFFVDDRATTPCAVRASVRERARRDAKGFYIKYLHDED